MTMHDNLPIVFLACQVFQHLIEAHMPAGLVRSITFLDYGLHQVPRNLKNAIQEQIDGIDEPSLVVLGYGLCGNGMDGIQAGKHALLIPRADDCIAILLGSFSAYQREFQSVPGTYYLSKGWLESGSNPLSEYRGYVERYGVEKADWLMDVQYRNYTRLVFVAHSQEEIERYRSQAKEVAEYCQRWGMRYEEIIGSEDYIRHLVELAASLELADEDFILIPPGGELKQAQFIR
jgi:hypothetical protein